MSYADIIVMVYPFPRTSDVKRVKFLAQMRFQKGTNGEFKPIGSPFIQWANQKCHARRVDMYCEMCHYNRLVTL
ncbi:hypothetical protein GCK32_022533 [Trichostrongylus colubriformis]|uniref:Uncharacterized protein n=1 Tax=Trichostrongylus colubriformis TaxID=6319 RepID=A0AAN8GDM5_TRICO